MIIFDNISDKLPNEEYLMNILEYCKEYLLKENRYFTKVNLDERGIEYE